MEDFLPAWGVKTVPVVAGDRVAMAEAIRSTKNVKLVFVESPANPTLVMSDLRAASVAAWELGERRPLLLVDNTFLGPVFQHPLALGADIVLYSATKYLGGFSDVIAGVALARDPELLKPLRGYRILFGNILPPDECWILDSRLPTVKLRMNRQSKNAQRIAEALNGHPALDRVYYPTLCTDPEQQRIYAAQCDFPGGMLSIELKRGKPAAVEFLRRLKIGRNAVSLGGVETLVCHPNSTTHSGLSEEACRVAGISEGLVRLSVGIEDWRDLLSDFEQALDGLRNEPASY